MAKTQRQSTSELKSIKESQPKTISTKTSSGGYTDTTTKNKDGSTTNTSSKPQYGSSGTVANEDGSRTVYNGKGGYTTYDSKGNQTGAGLYGAENWDSKSGNVANLPGYENGSYGGSSKDQSVAALSGDMNALGSFNNEQDLYNRLLGPQESLQLTALQKQRMYNSYLDSANKQLNPLIDNYTKYFHSLKQQQQNDMNNMDSAYNKSAADMFSNQFAQNGQLQQQMANRGMSNTGIAADALVRQQMAGNSDLQNAFIAAQGQKADMNRQYNDQFYDMGNTLAELSPESMAAKNLDAYIGGYAEQQNIANQNQQKTLLEMYNTLLGNNTDRFTNVNDNNAKVQMNENDNYTAQSNNQLDNYTKLTMNENDNSTSRYNTDVDSYTVLTKAQMDNAVTIATESGKLVLAQDIARTQATGTVYIGGKQLLVNGKPIPTLDFMKLSEENRHNIATENNVKEGNYLDYTAAMDGNNAKREGDQLDFTQGMDANEVKRQKIAADVGIAAKKIELGYANLEKDYFVAQGNIDKAAASLAMTARNAGNAEAQTAIKTIQAKITAVKAQIKNDKPTKAQQKVLEGLLGELDAVGKQIAATPITSESGNDINSLIP